MPQGLDFTTQGDGSDATLNARPTKPPLHAAVLAGEPRNRHWVNAGVELNGDSPGESPVQVAEGVAYSAM